VSVEEFKRVLDNTRRGVKSVIKDRDTLQMFIDTTGVEKLCGLSKVKVPGIMPNAVWPLPWLGGRITFKFRELNDHGIPSNKIMWQTPRCNHKHRTKRLAINCFKRWQMAQAKISFATIGEIMFRSGFSNF
jgi:hypothetical protein